MADVIGAEPVILYGVDVNGVPVPLKLGTDGTLSAASGLALGSTPSTQAFGDAAAAGASVLAAPELHVHGMPALGTTPSTQAMGDAAAGGSATTPSKNDHKHGMPSFATPAIVLGTAAAAGAATTPIRSDATIVAFDATVPAAAGGTAAAGSQAVAARRDHVHNVADQTITERMLLHAAQTADVTTSQTTTSTSYADLATTGPAVTVSPGVTQPHLILIAARKSNSSNGSNNFASVAIAGAAAADVDADMTSGAAGHEYSAVKAILATAQSSGATHTMKYKVSGGTGTYLNRRIIGIPM